MKLPGTDDRALISSFSSTKRQILVILKREGEIDLANLSKELGITKMGVLNHIKNLEEMEIIDRFEKRGGVGRPRLAIRLSPNSSDIFPKAYAAYFRAGYFFNPGYGGCQNCVLRISEYDDYITIFTGISSISGNPTGPDMIATIWPGSFFT